jgi:Domain of unknown function (DUF4263)
MSTQDDVAESANDHVIGHPEWTFDAMLLEHNKAKEANNPRIGHVTSTVLKEGPPVWKVASFWEVLNEHTGELHHRDFRIDTYRHYKKEGWKEKRQYSASLKDEETDEIGKLVTFLEAVLHADLPDERGDFLVVRVERGAVTREDLVTLLSLTASPNRVKAVTSVLAALGDDPEELHSLMEQVREHPDEAREAATVLNLARFTTALEDLDMLIAANSEEREFQRLLKKNEWMFGSEYSELLQRRVWTRDRQQDFMLRRTADGYLELIEIKRPLNGEDLFKPVRNSLAPKQEITDVLGQVFDYLEELDGDEYRIAAKDKEKVSKARAKIVIGRDGGEDQQAALRRLNAHLHRVEVMTFDQLRRIAQQVIAVLEQSVMSPGEEELSPNGELDGKGYQTEETSDSDFDNMPF